MVIVFPGTTMSFFGAAPPRFPGPWRPRAWRFFLLSAFAVVALGALTILPVGGVGKDCPDTDGLCMTGGHVRVVVIPTLLSLILSVISAWKTYQTWSQHIRWRPWLFATYGMWMLTTACPLATSTFAVVEMG